MTGVIGSGRRGTTGIVLAAALLCGGAVGCTGSDDGAASGKAGKDKADSAGKKALRATDALTAAYKKTAAAKSAKVEMTVSTPSALGGGDMQMSGVMGWDPTVMDMTVDGSALAAQAPDAPEQMRVLWQDDVMYMDLGAAAAKDMDGKRWMKMDLAGLAKASGNEELLKSMTGSLDEMNQDPAQQLAVLLDSPNVKHVGSSRVGGVQAEHYKGTLTVEEMLNSENSLDVLGKKERQKLLDTIKKTGIKGYDTEVWVNKDDYPVRMDVVMDSPQGKTTMTTKYSDYGAGVKVSAPPAGQTFDIMDMLDDLKDLGADASGAASS